MSAQIAPLVLALGDARPDIDPTAFLARTATVVGRVAVGAHANVWYGCVLRADREEIRIGAHVNVQDLACLHSDPDEPTIIRDRVSVGHGAVVHGAYVGEGALIGIGAVVLGRARIGSGALVAAGAVVRPGDVVPPGHLVAGVPARIIRPVTEVEVSTMVETASQYVAAADRHRHAR